MAASAEVHHTPIVSARWRSIAVCGGIFLAYLGTLFVILGVLKVFASPFLAKIPAPKGAPAIWWRVDENAVLSGASDLIAAILPVFIYCRVRKLKLADLGFNRMGTLWAWVIVAAGQAWLVYSNIHSGPVSRVPGALGSYALVAAVIAGLCAAFAEETFFRGFVMTVLQRAGFGVIGQILVSAVLFGLAHIGYAFLDWTTMVFTLLLGLFWGFVYVLGKRSLWPTIAAHVLNDAVVIPAVYYLIILQRTAH